MTNRQADVIERLQRLRKIMAEEINLEKQVCKIKSKRDLDTNITLNRLSPIPQDQTYRPLKKSSRNAISKSKNEPRNNYPQKTAPIRRKKSPDLRKSSAQKTYAKEKTAIQTITEYKGSRPKSLTRSKRTSQNQHSSGHRKMKNMEIQTGTNYEYAESEKRISEMHQDRLKRYFFGIWLRQRLRVARQDMDNTLKRRATSHEDQYYAQTKHKSRKEKDQTRHIHKNEEYIDYYNNENINHNPKATVRRRSLSRKSDKVQSSNSRRKNSVTSSQRNRKYQTEYIIETDKCKTKVKRQPTNVLESEITRLLEAKKQHVRVPSPIRSRTTISTTKTVKRSKRKPSKTSSDVPNRHDKATIATKTTSKRYTKDDILEDDDYDDIEADVYLQKIRQQKLLKKFEEEQKQKRIDPNVHTNYGYIPKTDNDSLNDRILTKPKIPSRTQYNQIIDEIEEEQRNQKKVNFFNNDSNSASSSNSIKNIDGDSESFSNIQKVQSQTHKSEEISSDILNISLLDEKRTTELNSFDFNDLGIKKNKNKTMVADLHPHSSDEDINLVPPQAFQPKKPLNSTNQKVASSSIQKVDPLVEKRRKEQQEIKKRLEKIEQENYLFSSSDESNPEDFDNEFKLTVDNQQKQNSIVTTTTTTTKVVKDEIDEIVNDNSTVNKVQKNYLDERFNSDDLFSSDKIENMINDEFSSELAKGTNRFSSHSSSLITTDKSKYKTDNKVSQSSKANILTKPQKQTQYLYVKTSKRILDEFIEEEEEEDFDINKYLSEEYRENPSKNQNKVDDKLDYSDIELNNEKLKKVESNISEDLSFSLNDVNTNLTEEINVSKNEQVTKVDLEIIEEEEEHLEDEVDVLPSATKNDEFGSVSHKELSTKDDEKENNISNDFELNENFIEEEEEEQLNKSEPILKKEELNKSSDEIADLLKDDSSDFEEVNIKNNSDTKENKEEQNSDKEIEIDVDDFEDNEKAEQENKNKAEKSDNDSGFVDEFLEISDDNEKESITQKVTAKTNFPFRVDFEIDVDDLSSDNLDEKQTLEYELLPPTTLTEALGLPDNTTNEETSITTITKTDIPTKTQSLSDDEFLDDVTDDEKNNKDKSKKEADEKESTNSDIELDLENDDDDADGEKKETENKSGSEIDDFVEDFNDDKENEPSKEKVENEISKDNEEKSDEDIEINLDGLESEDENKTEQENKNKAEKSDNDSGFVDEFLEISDDNEKESITQKVTAKTNFPFRVDFEIDVDDLSSDNLDEKQTLEYELLPPTTLTEALGLPDNTTNEETSITTITKTDIPTKTQSLSDDEFLDDVIDDISDDEKNKSKDKDQQKKAETEAKDDQKSDSDVEIEIDDFQMSEDEKVNNSNNNSEEKSNSDINIDDISINSEKEEEQKKNDSDINIDDISINSENENENEKQKKSEDSGFIIDEDFEIPSDTNNDETTVTTTKTTATTINNSIKSTTTSTTTTADKSNGFPFKTDFVVGVDDLSSTEIEERPKLNFIVQQQQQNKVTLDHESSDKDIEIEIDGDFEILSDNENEEDTKVQQKKQDLNANSNQVYANNNERLNQGIDNIADDFFIESDNGIDINDFQDNENEKGEAEESKQSDGIDIVLDDDLSDGDNQKQQKQDDDDIVLSDFEIDIDDSN